jgi:hypothetical protein
VNSLRIGGDDQERRYVSLGHDALAAVAADWKLDFDRWRRVRKWAALASGGVCLAVVMAVLSFVAWEKADEAAASAEKSRQSQEQAQENETKARNLAEGEKRAKERAQDWAARGILDSMGRGGSTEPDGATIPPFEFDALWELSSLQPEDDRVRIQFLQLAFKHWESARRLSGRMDSVLLAAVGLNRALKGRVANEILVPTLTSARSDDPLGWIATNAAVSLDVTESAVVIPALKCRLTAKVDPRTGPLRSPFQPILSLTIRTPGCGYLVAAKDASPERGIGSKVNTELVEALITTSGRLDPNDRHRVVEWVRTLMRESRAHWWTADLAKALAAIGQPLAPDQAKRVADQLLRSLKEAESPDRKTLSEAIASADHMLPGTEVAKRAAESYLKALDQIKGAMTISAPDTRAFSILAPWLDRQVAKDATPLVCSWLTVPILEGDDLVAIAELLAVLDMNTGGQVGADRLVKRVRELLRTAPHYRRMRHVAQALAAVSPDRDHAGVRQVANQFAVWAMNSLNRGDQLGTGIQPDDRIADLGMTLTHLSPYVDTDTARLAIVALLEKVRGRIVDQAWGQRSDPPALAHAVAAVGTRLDPTSLRTARVTLDQIVTTLRGRGPRSQEQHLFASAADVLRTIAEPGPPGRPAEDRFAASSLYQMGGLTLDRVFTIMSLCRRPDTAAAQQWLAAYLRHRNSVGWIDASAGLKKPMGLDKFLRKLDLGDDMQTYAQFLKAPTCVGPVRDRILDRVSALARQRFVTVWEFEAWCRVYRPHLDFTSPPTR